jgi:hypothetical protein
MALILSMQKSVVKYSYQFVGHTVIFKPVSTNVYLLSGRVMFLFIF